MEMFLMVLTLSLVGVLVSGVLFAAASRDARRVGAASLLSAAAPEERFFMMRAAARPRARSMTTSDVLALQLAHHVRLEQAAAEAFRQFPTAEALHMPTLSPLAG
jgi:hypothetical protein